MMIHAARFQLLTQQDAPKDELCSTGRLLVQQA